jgi:hypothetical protein
MKTNWWNSRWKKALGLMGACAFLVLSAAYFLVSLQIGSSVRGISAEAMQAHSGNRVEALMQYVEDPGLGLRNRNHAVWALGQLGDARALPVLEKYHTGQPCDHTSALCQRELDKAIHLVSGGVNVTAIVWRRASPPQGANSG